MLCITSVKQEPKLSIPQVTCRIPWTGVGAQRHSRPNSVPVRGDPSSAHDLCPAHCSPTAPVEGSPRVKCLLPAWCSPQPLEVPDCSGPALQQILTDGSVQSHVLLVGSVVLVLLATELTGVISSFCERNKDKGQEGGQPSHTTPSFLLQRNSSGDTNIPHACGTCLPCNPQVLFPRR